VSRSAVLALLLVTLGCSSRAPAVPLVSDERSALEFALSSWFASPSSSVHFQYDRDGRPATPSHVVRVWRSGLPSGAVPRIPGMEVVAVDKVHLNADLRDTCHRLWIYDVSVQGSRARVAFHICSGGYPKWASIQYGLSRVGGEWKVESHSTSM
jgi:hypothetical protein